MAVAPTSVPITTNYFSVIHPNGLPSGIGTPRPLLGKTVLVVLAHPDDETYCSTTMAKLKQQGARVVTVYATSGDLKQDLIKSRGIPSGAPMARHREQLSRSALKRLGIFDEPQFLKYPDGCAAKHQRAMVRDIQKFIQQEKPDVIITFGPEGMSGHFDHISVGKSTLKAAQKLGYGNRVYHLALNQASKDAFGTPPEKNPYGSYRNDLSNQVTPDQFIRAQFEITADLEKLKEQAMRRHDVSFMETEIKHYMDWFRAFRLEQFSQNVTFPKALHLKLIGRALCHKLQRTWQNLFN